MEQPNDQPVRGFFFWSLAPFLVIFLVVMPLAILPRRDAGAIILLVSVEGLALLVLLGLFNPYRFWWAWRGVGAIIFVGYCAYLIAMLIKSGGKIALRVRPGEASAFNSILGLVIFGFPGLFYALIGRLPFWMGRAAGARDTDEWQRLWDARLAALEAILGPADDTIFHAPVPFDLGGAADVVMFAQPSGGVTYVTADIIGDESSIPNDLGQYELMICLRESTDWAPNLISNLAMYSKEAVLAAGHTMDIGSALPQPTRLTAFLYLHHATLTVDGQQASLLLCIGITSDELAFVHEHGRDALVNRLKAAGVYPYTELARSSALISG